jgi:hypothetical protein
MKFLSGALRCSVSSVRLSYADRSIKESVGAFVVPIGSHSREPISLVNQYTGGHGISFVDSKIKSPSPQPPSWDFSFWASQADPLSQQFAKYNGDLINPYTNSTGDTAFSGPTNSTERYKPHRSGPTLRHGIGPGSREHNVALNEWATSMMLSHRSPALRGWPTYDVPMMVGWMGTPVKVSDYPAGLKNLF